MDKKKVCLCKRVDCPGCRVVAIVKEGSWWVNAYDWRDGRSSITDPELRKRLGLPEDPASWWKKGG